MGETDKNLDDGVYAQEQMVDDCARYGLCIECGFEVSDSDNKLCDRCIEAFKEMNEEIKLSEKELNEL